MSLSNLPANQRVIQNQTARGEKGTRVCMHVLQFSREPASHSECGGLRVENGIFINPTLDTKTHLTVQAIVSALGRA